MLSYIFLKRKYTASDCSHLNISQVLKSLNIAIINYLGIEYDKYFLYLSS